MELFLCRLKTSLNFFLLKHSFLYHSIKSVLCLLFLLDMKTHIKHYRLCLMNFGKFELNKVTHQLGCIYKYIYFSQCSFSVLLRWAIAIKVWAYAIKMLDQHKYYQKRIFASYKMFREGIEILILSVNYFKLSIT